jgi:hypothetical protein
MTVRAEDLPPEVRKRLGLEDQSKASKKSRAGVGLSAPCPGHCGCGCPFPTAAAWERHARKTGCRHWRIDLTQGAM